MRTPIAEVLRKLAGSIELDNTPTDAELEEKKTVSKPTTNVANGTNSKGSGDEVQHEVIKPTSQPKIKPPRRDPSYKPNKWESKQHRKEYMLEWRAQGRDVETGNKYIKKNNKKDI